MRGILLKKPDLKKHEWLHSLKICHLDENQSAGNSKFLNQMSEKGKERIKTCWLTGDYYTTSYSVGGSQIQIIDLAVFQMCA